MSENSLPSDSTCRVVDNSSSRPPVGGTRCHRVKLNKHRIPLHTSELTRLTGVSEITFIDAAGTSVEGEVPLYRYSGAEKIRLASISTHDPQYPLTAYENRIDYISRYFTTANQQGDECSREEEAREDGDTVTGEDVDVAGVSTVNCDIGNAEDSSLNKQSR